MVRSALLALSSQNSLQKSPEANPSTSGASYMKLTVALSPRLLGRPAPHPRPPETSQNLPSRGAQAQSQVFLSRRQARPLQVPQRAPRRGGGLPCLDR